MNEKIKRAEESYSRNPRSFLGWFFLFFALLIIVPGVRAANEAFKAKSLSYIRTPKDLRIQIFASEVPGARSMALGDDGTLFVGTRDEGKVYALKDLDGDGVSDQMQVILEGLEFPNGVAMLYGDLYVATLTGIIKVPKAALDQGGRARYEVVFEGFSPKRMHGWKALLAGDDGWLYLAIGVPCNICLPADPYEGRLIRLHPPTAQVEILAEGLRNSVGLTFEPVSKEIWLTDNGRDYLGNLSPADELNHFEVKGTHFGYPFCHGKNLKDPDLEDRAGCARQTAPAWEFGAHVAPLGLRFYQGKQLPERYQGQLFVAQHGSWNRSPPEGYRIVMIHFKEGRPVSENAVADGWLRTDGKVMGRPVDLLELGDGSMLISDDYAGMIYRLTSNPAEH